MAHLRSILAAILALVCVIPSLSQPDREKINRLEQRLVESKTPQDSLPILFDLYDVSPASDSKHYATMLYATATRMGNNPARLEAIRYLLNASTDPLEIFEYTRIAGLMPESEDQWETVVFGRLKKYAATVPSLTETNRQDMLREAIKSYDQGEFMDDKAEIEQLYKLCIFLNASTKGKLYLNYMNRLKALLDKLPESKSNALKNMFYVQLSIQALNNEDFNVCLESVEQALKIADQLEKKRYKEGRKFARYRLSKYTLLRRKLACFPILSREEVEKTYNDLLELANQDASLMDDFNDPASRVKIYYNMATKNYTSAVPYLKKYLEDPSAQFRRTMLSYLAEAAEATGDRETLITALKDYNAMLQDYIISDGDERYCELQIIYDTHHLRSKALKATQQMQEKEARLNTILIIIGIVLAVIIGIFLYIIINLKRRIKHLPRDREDYGSEL